MKKMVRPASLSLAMPKHVSPVSSTIASPTERDRSSPSPRHLHTSSAENPQPLEPHSVDDQSNSPDLTSLPPFPTSPLDTPTHSREPSRGFFANMKPSKSSNRIFNMEPTIRHVSEDTARSNVESSERSLYSLRKTTGSTPDLSLLTMQSSATDDHEGRLFLLDLQKITYLVCSRSPSPGTKGCPPSSRSCCAVRQQHCCQSNRAITREKAQTQIRWLPDSYSIYSHGRWIQEVKADDAYPHYQSRDHGAL